MKHIYCNKNTNVMHLFEEEMQTEKKRKRNVEGYKTRHDKVNLKSLMSWLKKPF